MRGRAGTTRTALVAAAALLLATVTTQPARAAVTGITPSSGTVVQGDSTAATVRISRQGVSCLRVDTGDAPGVSASVQQSCSDETWTTRLSVSTRPDTPPGTYPITVDDGDGSATFSLRVTSPPPPTPPRTTTTRPPSTTAKPPPTTAAPTTTTTEPPTTTTTSTTTPEPTTTTAPPPPNDGFVAIPDLIARGLPKTGLFLPLSAFAYRTCLPLTEPCTAPDSPLVLLPARAHDVTWTPPAPDEATTPSALRTPPLPPVGQRPDDATTSTYRVPVLDLATTRTATVTTVARALDGRGHLVATDDTTTSPLEPTPAPAPAEPESPPGEATEDFAVFDRPIVIDTTSLTEASPVLVAVGRQVVYAVAADPSWNRQDDVIPLFGDSRVPFLVRGAEGPAGILVAAPPGAEPDPQGDLVIADEPNGSSPVLPLAFLAAIVGLGVWTFRRRQRGVPRDLAP